LHKIVFSEDATFDLSGKINRHNLINRDSQDQHQVDDHVPDSPMNNTSYAISKIQVYSSFRFDAASINVQAYLDMLKNFLVL